MILKIKILRDGDLIDWQGDLETNTSSNGAGPIVNGDWLFIKRPVTYDSPVYWLEGVKELKITCPVIINVILDPKNITVIKDIDGNDVVFQPAPWVANWQRVNRQGKPDGSGRVGKGRFLAYIKAVMEAAERAEEEEQEFTGKMGALADLLDRLKEWAAGSAVRRRKIRQVFGAKLTRQQAGFLTAECK